MTRRTPPFHAALPALAVFATLAVAAPSRADDRDDRIRELERVVHEQAAEQARLRDEVEAMKAAGVGSAPDGGALRAAVEDLLRSDPQLADRFATRGATDGAAHGATGLSLGGYFSTRWVNSELPGDKPTFQDLRFVLQASSQISRYVRFKGEIEFEHGGVSDETDGEVKIEYAEIAFSECEAFVFKAGSLLVPWGRFNSMHDDPLNELSSRPTVSRYVHGVVHAGPGIGVEGVIAQSDDLSFNYDVVLNNGLADDFSSGDGIRDARTLWDEDENHDKTLFGRFGVVPTVEFVDALDLGTSFAWGKLGEGADDDMRGYGFDVAARKGPWELKGEWAHLGVDRDDAAAPLNAVGDLGPIRGMTGWYGQLLYRFREDWVRALPFADDSASVALVLRRDAVDLIDRVRGAAPPDDERAWTIGINYRPGTRTVIKLEYRMAESAYPGREGSDRNLVALEFATYF